MNGKKFETQLFLVQFKNFTSNGKFKFERRKKSLDTLARLGITIEHAKEEILSLSHRNYSSGPEPDYDRPGDELWKFGKMIEGIEIYIKLKVIPRVNMAKCLSFHFAERELEYPLV